MAVDPFFGTNPVMQSMEQRRGYIEQLRQNTTRLAQSYNAVETQGTGTIRLDLLVAFSCTFIERPVVAYGYTVENGLLAASTGAVYGWELDNRGYYVGANVFVVVTAGTVRVLNTADPSIDEAQRQADLQKAADAIPIIQHDFTFTGLAMKDLPDYLLDL